jgi:hypothetical protein
MGVYHHPFEARIRRLNSDALAMGIMSRLAPAMGGRQAQMSPSRH